MNSKRLKKLCLLLMLACIGCSSRYSMIEPVQIKEKSAMVLRIEQIEKAGEEEREQREGRIDLEMTKAQATVLWGKPEKVNRTRIAAASSEQWVYGGNRYLYFNDGILTAIQDTR